jgi:hypothetical protein
MDIQSLTPPLGRLKCVWITGADGRLESIWVPDWERDAEVCELPSQAAEPVRKADHLRRAG